MALKLGAFIFCGIGLWAFHHDAKECLGERRQQARNENEMIGI
jgi:hypothetical protein